MTRNTITKEALASALKNLVKNKAFEKITIKDITDFCDISRNTFYYHFTDKYDLLNWIFISEVLKPVDALFKAGLWGESFVDLCQRLREDRGFYLKIFRYTGKYSLQDYLINFYSGLLEDYMRRIYARIGCSPPEREVQLIARMQAHSYVGIVMDWIYADMDDDHMCCLQQLEEFIKKAAEYAAVPQRLPLSGAEKVLAQTRTDTAV